MSAIFIDDGIVHYEAIGRGQPIIFLHSWIGSWRYWVTTMQIAASRYRSYALDLWGFGDSDKHPGKYTLEHQISLLGDFIQHMGLHDVTLIGHGLGALVVSFYAADHPEIVKRTMLISFPLENDPLHRRLLYLSVEEAVTWLLGRHPDQEISRQEALKTDRRAIKLLLHQALLVNRRQLALRMPVLALWIFNSDDPISRPPTPNTLNILPELSGQVVFPKSDHFPMLREANRFCRLLSEFMETEPDRKPSHLTLKQEWRRRLR